MDWLYALAGIFGIVALAFLFGWAGKAKNTAAQWAILIGVLLFLLWLKGWLGDVLLLLALVFHSIDNLPPFIRYAIAVAIVFWLAEYRVRVMVTTEVRALAAEIEKTNARIALMESSLTAKLDDIASRLPEED